MSLSQYGMTQEDYAALLSTQEGVCAGCQRPPKKHKRLCVDHNHRTGEVRGLLCDFCNTLIGYVHEDADLLDRLGDYLWHWPARDVFETPRRHRDAPPWEDQ